MCGIIGYSGNEKNAIDIILDGLEKLEYRGYDSAGIAFVNDNKIYIEKKEGRLQNLKNHIEKNKKDSNLAIGHTRWATHGVPTDRNSHPHYSQNGDVALVHNGIIENYAEIKNDLISKNIKFNSDTDSEVVAQLFSYLYDGNLLSTLDKVLNKIRGSYSLAIIHEDFPDEILCCKNQSPLVLGISENKNFIASDISAILKYTRNIIFLDDGERAIIKKDSVKIFNESNEEIKKEINFVEWNFEQASKGGYKHFMLKEIEEQAEIVEKTLNVYTDNSRINFDEQLKEIDINSIDRIYIVACGTAFYAGLQGQHFFKKLLGIDVFTEIASEFRYSDPIITDKTLAIFVSQSGETFDTLMSLKFAKEKGAKTLAISNVLGSTITRESDSVIFTLAGPEISVASTKAYSSQVLVLYLLTLYLALKKEKISLENYKNYIDDIEKFRKNLIEIIENKEKIHNISKKIKHMKNGFYIGRGIDKKVADEGSLKMKEVNYIHTESIAAGELKHGSIALIEKDVLVVAICTDKNMDEKIISNIKEVKARGAYVVSVSNIESEIEKVADENITIKNSGEFLTALSAVITLQYLAYFTALENNVDVDKPRNLAKSVTVE